MITTLLLILIYLSFISLGLPDSLLGSAWPSIYGTINVPLHYAGYVSMIIAGGTVVSSICSEKMIQRFGTGLVTALSVLLTAAALAGFSLSRAFWSLCLCAVPLGLGAGSVDAALNNYVALHYRARHMSWLHCFWGIGASTGPLIMSAYLTQGRPWNGGYRAVGIIQLCLVALLFSSLPLWGRIKTKNPHGEATAGEPVSLRRLLRLSGLRPILVAFFCYCALEAITGLWGSSFLVRTRNIPPEVAARWIALYYGGITAGRFVSGFLTMRFNNRQMVRLGQCLAASGIAALAVPIVVPVTAQIAAHFNYFLLAGFFLIGLGCAPIYPSLLHETPENFGSGCSQAIMGLQMASAYVGTTLMPPLFGRLAAQTGFALFPPVIGMVLLMQIIMTETANKKVSGTSPGVS
jgi:fucose permease